MILLIEKVVPQVVDSAPQQQFFAGKGHDIPDFLPVCRAVTVDMAILAGRFGIKGAEASLLHAMLQQLGTLRADGQPFFPPGWLELCRQLNPVAPLQAVMCLAVHLDETGKYPDIL